jgi:hypothetical protein
MNSENALPNPQAELLAQLENFLLVLAIHIGFNEQHASQSIRRKSKTIH